MRPKSIVQFEQLYLISWGVALLASLLAWENRWAEMERTAIVLDLALPLILTVFLIGLAIPLVLLYFAARRRSVIAKWIIVVLAALGVLSAVLALFQQTLTAGLSGFVEIVAIFVRVLAVVPLFNPDAKAWFAGTPLPAPVEPAIGDDEAAAPES